jgi:uncharacterized membrane protein
MTRTFTTASGTTITGTPHRRPLILAGVVLGKGLGGFVDGILFHQVLQIHHMLSARRDPTDLVNVQVNMLWDGFFHTFTWIATTVGIWLLFRAGKRPDVPWSGRTLAGSMLMGWGLFNLIEGLIDHHILHVHHVIERLGLSGWDYAFLTSGVVFIVVGWLIVRADRAATEHPTFGGAGLTPHTA